MRVPREEEALRLWLADQAPTATHRGKAPLFCFLCLVRPALCLGWCARVLGMDGLREPCTGSLEPREHHSGRLCVSPGQAAQPRHRALSSGSFLGGLEVDMLLLLQENVLCSKHVRGGGGACEVLRTHRDTGREAPGKQKGRRPRSRSRERVGSSQAWQRWRVQPPDLGDWGPRGHLRWKGAL